MAQTKPTEATEDQKDEAKSDTKANEAAVEVTTAELAREEKGRGEVVLQQTNSDIPTGQSPAEGPVPRNADPFAHQRAAGAGDFKKLEDEDDGSKEKSK